MLTVKMERLRRLGRKLGGYLNAAKVEIINWHVDPDMGVLLRRYDLEKSMRDSRVVGLEIVYADKEGNEVKHSLTEVSHDRAGVVGNQMLVPEELLADMPIGGEVDLVFLGENGDELRRIHTVKKSKLFETIFRL